MVALFAVVGFNEIIPLVVMAGVVAAIFAGLTLISKRNSRATDRLDRWSRPASRSSRNRRPFCYHLGEKRRRLR